MTKEQIFNYFYTNSANFGIKTILLTMLAGLAIGAIIYLTYWITYKGVAYNSKFNISLVVILLISVVIMLMISSNIVISLGMVGALSIVRFRTAVKDSRDTVFIFWAISEGLCVGSQNNMLALVTTLVIAVVIMLSSYIPRIWNKYLVVITGGEEVIDTALVVEKMKPFIVGSQMRAANRGKTHQEMIFEIKTRGEIDLKIINELSAVEGVKSVNWIAEAGETLG